MPKPPVKPGFFDKVNYVIDAWARPCDAPWYIYVETLKPALLKAFITLITFGWDDVARGYFRPRGLGGRRTGKRKGRGARAFPRFPELGDTFGRNLPGADEVKGQNWSRAGKTLWRIDSASQRVLFWWLVANITNDFAFEWTSVLYETRWCQASALGRFSYHRTDAKAISGGFWQGVSYLIKDYEVSPPLWINSAGNTGPTSCLVAATIDFKPFPGESAPTSIGLRIRGHFTQEIYMQTGPEAPDPDGTISLPVSGTIPAGVVFNVEVWHDAVFAIYTEGIVTAMANET